MKRLLLVLALIVLPLFASAQVSDTLLTPDGGLFAIEVSSPAEHPDVVTESTAFFTLIVRNGDSSTREPVPATLTRGHNSDPAIAYDSESGMLFLLWLRHSGLLYNELLVASRDASGVWSEPAAIGRVWDYRQNLRIAVTRNVDDEETGTQIPGITVHASWWEYSASGSESARYAMLTIEGGMITNVQDLDLAQFVDPTVIGAEEIDPSVLKQPLLQSSAQRDSVTITFGDLATRTVNQVSVRPRKVISEGRLRVPIGKRETTAPAPSFAAASEGRVEGVFGGKDRLGLVVRGIDKVQYVVLKDGVWSESRSIALDAEITTGAAMDAVRRLVNEH